jgi:hypothetical protein
MHAWKYAAQSFSVVEFRADSPFNFATAPVALATLALGRVCHLQVRGVSPSPSCPAAKTDV